MAVTSAHHSTLFFFFFLTFSYKNTSCHILFLTCCGILLSNVQTALLLIKNGLSCLFTYAADIVRSKNLIVMTQADDKPAIFITFAALSLAVAAVQMHFYFSLAMTLHCCKQNRDTEQHLKLAKNVFDITTFITGPFDIILCRGYY